MNHLQLQKFSKTYKLYNAEIITLNNKKSWSTLIL